MENAIDNQFLNSFLEKVAPIEYEFEEESDTDLIYTGEHEWQDEEQTLLVAQLKITGTLSRDWGDYFTPPCTEYAVDSVYVSDILMYNGAGSGIDLTEAQKEQIEKLIEQKYENNGY